MDVVRLHNVIFMYFSLFCVNPLRHTVQSVMWGDEVSYTISLFTIALRCDAVAYPHHHALASLRYRIKVNRMSVMRGVGPQPSAQWLGVCSVYRLSDWTVRLNRWVHWYLSLYITYHTNTLNQNLFKFQYKYNLVIGEFINQNDGLTLINTRWRLRREFALAVNEDKRSPKKISPFNEILSAYHLWCLCEWKICRKLFSLILTHRPFIIETCHRRMRGKKTKWWH